MAQRELHGVSPSYEALCLAVAADARICAGLDELPAPKRQPNLLLGAVRYTGGPVEDPVAFIEFVHSNWELVTETMRTHRTQTNEPGRCATLLPVLSSLPQPLALIEVGASAGLCLYPDRYAYRYLTSTGAHRVGDGPLVLPCEVTGPAPLPSSGPQVVWRAGIDLNPLRPDRVEDRRWLTALVWPEQRERAGRLQLALDLAALEPARIDAGDLLTELPNLVTEAPPDVTLVVFHSAVLAYLGPAQRSEFDDLMRTLGRTRDVHWVSNEAPGVIEGTEHLADRGSSRFVLAHNRSPVALAGPHGQSLEWLSP